MSWIDIEAPPPRFTQERTLQGVRIVVPAIKEWLLIAWCSVGLVAFPLAWWGDLEHFWTGADRSIGNTAWLLFVIFAVVFVSGELLWTMFGRETFLMGSDALEVRRCILGLGRNRTFPWDEICNLGFRQGGTYNVFSGHLWSALVFEHAGHEYAFARGLNGMEVDRIIALMQAHTNTPTVPAD